MSAKKTENNVVDPINPEVETPEVTKVKESNPTEPVNPEVTGTEENTPAEPTAPEIENEEKAEAKAKAEEEAKKAEEEAKAKAEANKASKNNSVKLKVLEAFTDKYTDESYKVNDEITVDEERAKELLAHSRRLVEELK